MWAAIVVLAVADVTLIMSVVFLLWHGIHFRSLGVRSIWIGTLVIFFIGFVSLFYSKDVPFTALLTIGLGCIVFLQMCFGAWLTDKRLDFVEKKMAENPQMKEAFEKNLILRTAWRFGQSQRKR